MREVTASAPGKVNLVLCVGAPTADGYHPLATVFEALDLRETVTVRTTRTPGTTVETVAHLPGGGIDRATTELMRAVPARSHLAVRAARAIIRMDGYYGAEYRIDIGAENPLDPLDLTAILGNLLANAAEALERLAPDAPRLLRLALVHQGDTLFLTADNSYDGELRYDADGNLLSSKRGNAERGIGMESIRTSLARYDGTMEIAPEDDLFAVSIVLRATQDRAANIMPMRTDGCREAKHHD